VIENGQSANSPQAPRSVPEGAPRNRFGFFGQINPYKGLDVLLEAIHRMSIDERKSIALEVHGANLESQSENFRLKIETLLKPLVEEGIVQMMGPYQPHELRNRMANVDWVCVSSVWWENSPMVIQEAFSNSRPLLVSDIGGMAEKVRHEVDGLLVPAGNAWAWYTALLRAGRDSKLFTQCHQGIRRPLSHDECAALHLQCMPTNGTTRSEAV
jgi:glycosyltransferase involved in cell wall biosynthesis